MFDAGKTRMIGLACGEKNYDNMLTPFSSDTGMSRTDRWTDLLYQYRVCWRAIKKIVWLKRCSSNSSNILWTDISSAAARLHFVCYWMYSSVTWLPVVKSSQTTWTACLLISCKSFALIIAVQY